MSYSLCQLIKTAQFAKQLLQQVTYFFSHHLQENLKHLVTNGNDTLHHT